MTSSRLRMHDSQTTTTAPPLNRARVLTGRLPGVKQNNTNVVHVTITRKNKTLNKNKQKVMTYQSWSAKRVGGCPAVARLDREGGAPLPLVEGKAGCPANPVEPVGYVEVAENSVPSVRISPGQ